MKTLKLKWISVKDKLPLEGQKVLCVQNPKTTATREALFAVFDGEKFYHPLPYYVKSDVKIGNWVDIIYWMPLPEIKSE